MMRNGKRVKKPNFSESESVTIIKGVAREKTDLLKSSLDNVTNKKKEEAWERITVAVNAVGGKGREARQVKKKWKDLKTAVIHKKQMMLTAGDASQIPDAPYEDLITAIIGEGPYPVARIRNSELAETAHTPNIGSQEEMLVPVLSVPFDHSFPEGATVQDLQADPFLRGFTIADLSAPGGSAEDEADCGARKRPASAPPQFQKSDSTFIPTKAAKTAMPQPQGKAVKKTLLTLPTPSTSSSSLSQGQSAQNKDDVWTKFMESEIVKNELKCQLLSKQLEMAEQQKSVMRLQEKELMLKVKERELRMGLSDNNNQPSDV